MLRIVWTFLVVMCSLAGADFSGIWEGRCEYPDAKPPRAGTNAVLLLKQEGEKLSGSAGPVAGHQFPIFDTQIGSNTILFSTNPGSGPDMKFKLTVSGASLKGEMTM